MSPGELQKDYCWVVVFVVVFIHLIPLLSYPSTAHPSTDFFTFYFLAKENIMTSAASWVFKDPWSWCKLTCLCPMPRGLGTFQTFWGFHTGMEDRLTPLWARNTSPDWRVYMWHAFLSYSCLLDLGSLMRALLPWKPSQMDVLFWIPSSAHPKAAKTQTFSSASQLWER